MWLVREDGSCPTRSGQPSAGEVCRVPNVAMRRGGAVVGYRLNGERLLCWRGTIRAALEFVVFLLKIVSGRGRWRAKGD